MPMFWLLSVFASSIGFEHKMNQKITNRWRCEQGGIGEQETLGSKRHIWYIQGRFLRFTLTRKVLRIRVKKGLQTDSFNAKYLRETLYLQNYRNKSTMAMGWFWYHSYLNSARVLHGYYIIISWYSYTNARFWSNMSSVCSKSWALHGSVSLLICNSPTRAPLATGVYLCSVDHMNNSMCTLAWRISLF